MSNQWELHLKKLDDGSVEARTESGAFVAKSDNLDELKEGLETEFGVDHEFTLTGLDDDEPTGGDTEGKAQEGEGSSEEKSQAEEAEKMGTPTLPPLAEPNPLELQVTELARVVGALADKVNAPVVMRDEGDFDGDDSNPAITKDDLTMLKTDIFSGVSQMMKEPTGRQKLAEIAKMKRVGNMLMEPSDVIREVMPILDKDPEIFSKIADEVDNDAILGNLYSVALVQRSQSDPFGLIAKPGETPNAEVPDKVETTQATEIAAAQRTLEQVAKGVNVHASSESAGSQSGDLTNPVDVAIAHLDRFTDDDERFAAEIAALDPKLREEIEDRMEEQELIDREQAQ